MLSIPPTSCGSERNFSTWGNIWSNNRARLLVGRVGMLVYLYFNSRALKRHNKGFAASDWEEFAAYLDTLPPVQVESEVARMLDIDDEA